MKVLFSYEAEQDDELSLNIGDIIKNVVMSEGGWWEGEINGQKGLFPDNFVEVISTGENNEDKENTNNEIKNSNKISMKKGHIAEMANKIKEGIQVGAMKSNKKAFSKKKLAKVCFDYTPDAEDELELHTGDVLEVLREVEVGWWEGRLNGKTGLFPSNFVECCENPDDEEKEKSVKTDEPEKKDISTDPETKGKKIRGVGFGNIFERGPIKLRPSTGGWKPEADDAKGEKSPPGNISTPVKKNRPCPEKAVARFSYHAENEDELSLKEGDIITVIEKELEDVGWWKGEINGRIGVFPDNFVELIPLQEELPKQKTGSSQSNSSGMRSTRSNSEPSKSDNKHSSSSSSSNISMSGSGSKDTGVLNTGSGIHGGLRKGRDSNDLSDKSALPALPSKKPYPPPPIGKKPIPTKPDIIRQSTIDNRELSRSSSSPKGSTSNLSENKSRDKESHREKDKDDKAFPDFDNLDLPPSEKLVHLTANRVKQPNKRPPSQVFLHTEEEKNELKESKEKETFRGEKKSAALTAVSMKEEKKSAKDDRKSLSMPTTPPPPPGIHSSKNYKKEENKEEAKRPVGYLSSSSSVSSVADPQKLRSPSLGKKSDLPTQSDVGIGLRSDDLKELLAEIKEMKANMVTRSSFEDLQAENERLRQDLESVKTTLHRKVRNIIDELDEEKKVRLNMQVEIDRMKKLVSESTI